MNKIIKTTFCASIIALSLLMTNCRDNYTKEFNRLLLELADNDQTIDRDDWEKIEDFLDSQKANFRYLLSVSLAFMVANAFAIDNHPVVSENIETLSSDSSKVQD